MSAAVVVVGSLNMDLVFRAERMPRPGETLAGGAFATAPGGKGGNQAVAAARLGASTAMIAAVGDDDYGRALRAGLTREAIDCDAVETLAGVATGVALVMVDAEGRNAIVVVGGANQALTPEAVDRHAALIGRARLVLVQLEIPSETVARTLDLARTSAARLILNPAPAAAPLPADWLAAADLVVPNEIEAAALTGLGVEGPDDARRAALELRAQGARGVIVTLGARGVYVLADGLDGHRPPPPAQAVDTTAAGDTFVGGLAAALAEGRGLLDAIGYGQAAAALSTTRRGAQPSIPRRNEIERSPTG